jgi:hypothetical protein
VSGRTASTGHAGRCSQLHWACRTWLQAKTGHSVGEESTSCEVEARLGGRAKAVGTISCNSGIKEGIKQSVVSD